MKHLVAPMGIRRELLAKPNQHILERQALNEDCRLGCSICAEFSASDGDSVSKRSCSLDACCHEMSVLTMAASSKCEYRVSHEQSKVPSSSGLPMLHASASISPVAENSIDIQGNCIGKEGLRFEAADSSAERHDGADVCRAQKPKDRNLFVVMEATLADIHQLSNLYERDYVATHMTLYGESEISTQAGFRDWENALGEVDFGSVLADIADASRGASKKTKPTKSKARQDPIVGIMKCVHKQGLAGKAPRVVGYLLFELREKGNASKRQQYCEIVNVVVSSQYRCLGAGRLLYEHLKQYLKDNFAGFAKDLRLYVAEFNEAPRAWYLRLGFKESGTQVEQVKGKDIKFIRMINELNEGSS